MCRKVLVVAVLAMGWVHAWAQDYPFAVQIIDKETGAPIAKTEVLFRWEDHSESHESDAEGFVRIELPSAFPNYFRVNVTGPENYVLVTLRWDAGNGDVLPVTPFTVPLVRGNTIGGIVVNEAGEPVEGASISILPGDATAVESDHIRLLAPPDDAVTTDDSGRWHYDRAAPGMNDYWLRAGHDAYISSRVYNLRPALETLLAGEARFVLDAGWSVSGTVRDARGNPVEEAAVRGGTFEVLSRVDTASDGAFTLPHLSEERQMLTVQKDGYAPVTQWIAATESANPLEIVLNPPKAARIRVVDVEGNPVEGVNVGLETTASGATILKLNGAEARTDADGLWSWPNAPAENLTLRVHLEGKVAMEPVSFVPDDTVHEVVMRDPLAVAGTIRDAETGAPLPGAVIHPVLVWSNGGSIVERGEFKKNNEGTFEYAVSRTDCSHAVYVRAPGYLPYTSETFRLGAAARKEFVIEMIQAEPMVAFLQDPEGNPVAEADIVLCTPSQQINITNGALAEWPASIAFTTDNHGRALVDRQTEPYLLVVLDERGFAEVPGDVFEANQQITLEPWAGVEGRLMVGADPAAGVGVTVAGLRQSSNESPIVHEWNSVQTDTEGRFTFARIAPRICTVSVPVSPWVSSALEAGPAIPLEPRPGEKVTLNIGGSGTTVTGSLASATPDRELAWNWGLNYLVRKAPGVTVPASVAALGFDFNKGWDEAWQSSAEGRLYMATLQHYFVKVRADGTFSIPDVPPGDYTLAFRIYDIPEGSCLTTPLATTSVDFTVDKDSGPAFDLGRIPVVANPAIHPGDMAPHFTAARLNGEGDIDLAQLRGKPVLLDFWATWCGPCKAELPNLKHIAETFGDDLTVVSLSLDGEAQIAQEFVVSNGLDWMQGHLGDWTASDVPQRYNVSFIPAIFLIDSDGRLVARDLRGSALVDKVAELVGAR